MKRILLPLNLMLLCGVACSTSEGVPTDSSSTTNTTTTDGGTDGETDGGSTTSTGGSSDDDGATTGVESGSITVTYSMSDMLIGQNLTCAQAGAAFVDLTLLADDEILVSLKDMLCDDAPIVLEDIALGSYGVDIVTWDEQLWNGFIEFEHDEVSGTSVVVPLDLVPVPCDPLAQDCSDGSGCYWGADMFVCLSTLGEIALGDACEFISDCSPGGFCADAAILPECMGANCCAAYCSITTPDCPVGGTECVPFFDGDPPAGYEDVGVCTLPP